MTRVCVDMNRSELCRIPHPKADKWTGREAEAYLFPKSPVCKSSPPYSKSIVVKVKCRCRAELSIGLPVELSAVVCLSLSLFIFYSVYLMFGWVHHQ